MESYVSDVSWKSDIWHLEMFICFKYIVLSFMLVGVSVLVHFADALEVIYVQLHHVIVLLKRLCLCHMFLSLTSLLSMQLH